MKAKTNEPAGEKKPQRSIKVLRPMRAIRMNCLECSGDSPKSVLWCPSSQCHFWPLRFGRRPETIVQRYGARLSPRTPCPVPTCVKRTYQTGWRRRRTT